MDKSKQFGRDGETAAVSFLEKRGVRIIYKNFRCKFGEIDIIGNVLDKGTTYLVAFEVKSRFSDRSGYGSEAVDYRKQRKICRSFDCFCLKYHVRQDTAVRFDVVEVDSDLRCRWIENAFLYLEI